ncbi:MAG: NADH-quinone oxidoreductase subunit C [Dissulfurimicrobium sp.]|uniref:NADH-quinone oxidoreductase subunit C n=1 Tax=Dissulfurimicrobium TaxID=1769732 RepID=UPI001EDA088B|nr:NADH-quinone oxidoreductase subunit C [Dissulfurimicrobium hydrothermale]UKL14417.1 NADH-quinone oxidoreductase subunit C [Dissulfurimicrobium hydrothermale]
MELKDMIRGCLGPLAVAIDEFRGDLSVEVPKSHIIDALRRLKDDPGLGFDFLSDLFGVDNSEIYKKKTASKKPGDEGPETPSENDMPSPPRFDVIYLLLSLKTNRRLRVKARIAEDDPVIDSVTSIWKAATWPEREVFDMYGIRFKGHPDLRRLLMWDEFPAHPLRKDYPLEGMGEERCLIYE